MTIFLNTGSRWTSETTFPSPYSRHSCSPDREDLAPQTIIIVAYSAIYQLNFPIKLLLLERTLLLVEFQLIEGGEGWVDVKVISSGFDYASRGPPMLVVVHLAVSWNDLAIVSQFVKEGSLPEMSFISFEWKFRGINMNFVTFSYDFKALMERTTFCLWIQGLLNNKWCEVRALMTLKRVVSCKGLKSSRGWCSKEWRTCCFRNLMLPLAVQITLFRGIPAASSVNHGWSISSK